MYNRKSLKNLRPPWKPGESGNPEGRPEGSTERPLRLPRLWTLKGPAPRRIICRACVHPDRPMIDGLLLLGVPLRSVEKRYRVSRSVLSRHLRAHLPELEGRKIVRDVVKAERAVLAAARCIRSLSELTEVDQEYVDRVAEARKTLWVAFPSASGPVGKLQYAMVVALFDLARVQGREFDFGADGTFDDLKDAQEALERWGRSGQETG